jgi:hypothetical protein
MSARVKFGDILSSRDLTQKPHREGGIWQPKTGLTINEAKIRKKQIWQHLYSLQLTVPNLWRLKRYAKFSRPLRAI